MIFFLPAREEAFRGARTLETALIDSTDRVDAIKKKFGTIRPLVVELESFKDALPLSKSGFFKEF